MITYVSLHLCRVITHTGGHLAPGVSHPRVWFPVARRRRARPPGGPEHPGPQRAASGAAPGATGRPTAELLRWTGRGQFLENF